MKRTLFDRIIGWFSPAAEFRRAKARAGIQLAERAYEIANTYKQSDWVSANANNANQEVKMAIAPGRQKARALAQNAPYGVKAIDVIVSETIGAGIVPNIKHSSKRQSKLLKQLWDEWANSTACDYEGRMNYYTMQQLAMRSIVESGEALAVQRYLDQVLKIQLLESDFINTSQDSGEYIQGIKVKDNRRVAYSLYTSHPGSPLGAAQSIDFPYEQLIHVYHQKRPGQLRGVTWAHAVIEKMKDFDDYQYATLLRQKISACFAGFITTPGTDSLLDAAALQERRQQDFNLQPATYRYLAPGEDFKQASPPGVDGYNDFNRETLRAIAAGWGISYESLTGDYSQSNYSSSRMGHLQMRKNIENWRWNMFIPQFCEVSFKWFLEYAKKRGIDVNGVSVQWVPPAYSMIDPEKEIAATVKEVRNGLKSWEEAVLEQGRDPEKVIEEIVDSNQKFDDNKLVLDIDPRHTSQQGLIQSNPVSTQGDNNVGQTNAPDQSTSGSSQQSNS